MSEPTVWEETNPPMASVQQQGPLSRCSDQASNDVFRNELTACLALVAPVGMTEEARRDWLAVAWGTLKHLPADVLESGCRVARETCDHPSKIVPAIIASTKDQMRLHREAREWSEPQQALPRPDYVTPEQAAEILKEFGLKRA